jgi:hypothetical protein
VGPTQGPASCSSFELLDEPAFVLLLPPVEIVDEDVPPEDAVWLALLSLWRLLFAHGPPPQPELELEVVPLEELPPVPLVLLLEQWARNAPETSARSATGEATAIRMRAEFMGLSLSRGR